MTKLRRHALSRLLSRDGDDTFTSTELQGLRMKHDKVYWHKTLCVNYTTYDLRRMQDSLNTGAHSDIILLAPDDDSNTGHPYIYARIVGLFHVECSYSGSRDAVRTYTRLDIAWVRWFQLDSDYSFGFASKRLPRLRFVPYYDSEAFGFIDPQLILRGVHLIPAFSHLRTQDLLPPSLARSPLDKDEDYKYYYVNM